MSSDERIKKSLYYSILDGTFWSIMFGFGESFFSVFAIFLKATNFQLGLLSSLPQAIGSVFQLLSKKLLKILNSRKKLVCFGVVLQAFIHIPVALVFFFGELRVYHLIFFICLYWIFGMVVSPAWNSWMGDLVDENQRGTYFGKRNRIIGLVAFFSMLLAGFILQRFSGSIQYIGFIIIFCIAFFSRIVSLLYLTKKYEPSYRTVPEAEFSLIDFIKQARFRNFGLYTLYLSFINFSIFLAYPFFSAYMLYDLNLSYMTYTIVMGVSLIVKYLSMPVWGWASDKYGTRKILSLSGFLMPVIPVLWIFSSEVLYLVIIQIYSGFIWAGFELASFNFVFDSTTPQKRATCVAYSNVLSGVAILVGGIIGAVIVKYNNVFWSKYLFVFLVSGILRYAASFIFIPKLKEVRNVKRISYSKLFFHVLTTAPATGIINNILFFVKKKK